MRIVIDARMDRTGIGRYTFSLIRELAMIDRQTEYILLMRREAFDAFDPPAPTFQKRLVDIPHYSLAEQMHLPGVLDRERPDLVHFPNFNVPVLTRQPYVVTIFDLTLFAHSTRRVGVSNAIRHTLKQAGFRTVVGRAAARARHILTMSESSRQSIVKHLNVDPSRITITPGGVDLDRFRTPDPSAPLPPGITQPFFLYVGAAYPHKNLPRLIEAFARFNRDARSRHQLVLAGDFEQFGESLKTLAGQLTEPGAVRFPGRISDAELGALFSKATGYVFVSLSEGFGLPGLEAMAHGVPVLAGRAGSLPEIYGDAALYVDPTDVPAIATQLATLAFDDAVRARLIAGGRVRAASFSWRRMAEETLAVYQTAAQPV